MKKVQRYKYDNKLDYDILDNKILEKFLFYNLEIVLRDICTLVLGWKKQHKEFCPRVFLPLGTREAFFLESSILLLELKTKKAEAFTSASSVLCRRQDLNLHEIAPGRFSYHHDFHHQFFSNTVCGLDYAFTILVTNY